MNQSFTKYLAIVAMAFVAFGLALEVQAEKKSAAVNGEVVEVSGSDVMIKTRKGEDVTIATDENTKVKIDGEDATVSDLQPGMHVTVPAFEGTAGRINATSRAGKAGGNERGGKKH